MFFRYICNHSATINFKTVIILKTISTLLCVLFGLLITTFATAQSENKKKILGCWEIKRITFEKAFEDQDQVSAEAIGTTVCFSKNGTFTNNMDSENLIQGKYAVSDDGKMIYQTASPDVALEDIKDSGDLPGKITVLSDTELKLETEEATLYFERSVTTVR